MKRDKKKKKKAEVGHVSWRGRPAAQKQKGSCRSKWTDEMSVYSLSTSYSTLHCYSSMIIFINWMTVHFPSEWKMILCSAYPSKQSLVLLPSGGNGLSSLKKSNNNNILTNVSCRWWWSARMNQTGKATVKKTHCRLEADSFLQYSIPYLD